MQQQRQVDKPSELSAGAADEQQALDGATSCTLDSAATTATARQQQQQQQQRVIKSASSSNVLSTVSLASGAQMKPGAPAQMLWGEPTPEASAEPVMPQAVLTDASRKGDAAGNDDGRDIKTTSAERSVCVSCEQKQQQQQQQEKEKEKEEGDNNDNNVESEVAQFGRDPQIQTPKPRINQLKQLLRHTNSLNQLPEFGIDTEHEQDLAKLMEQIDVWGLNIFEVHTLSQDHSLTAVMYKIFKVSSPNAKLSSKSHLEAYN